VTDSAAAKIAAMRFPRTFSATVLAALLVAPAVSSAEAAKSSPIARGTVKWRSIAEGEAEAKTTGKPVLYFFTAQWCSPCHILEDEVLSKPEVVAQVQKDFVTIRVEDRQRETGRNSAEMLALADRYGLRGFPTLVVSRPGSSKNVILEGWVNQPTAVEFLRTGKQQFNDLEKKPATKGTR
jgi:thiol:disulfide interchange protein